MTIQLSDTPCGRTRGATGCYRAIEQLVEVKSNHDDYYVAAVLVHELAHVRGADECGAEKAMANFLKRIGRLLSMPYYGHPIYKYCQQAD